MSYIFLFIFEPNDSNFNSNHSYIKIEGNSVEDAISNIRNSPFRSSGNVEIYVGKLEAFEIDDNGNCTLETLGYCKVKSRKRCALMPEVSDYIIYSVPKLNKFKLL